MSDKKFAYMPINKWVELLNAVREKSNYNHQLNTDLAIEKIKGIKVGEDNLEKIGKKQPITVDYPWLTDVPDGLFYGAIIESINAPNVKKIGNYSFYNCGYLKGLPYENIEEIGKYGLLSNGNNTGVERDLISFDKLKRMEELSLYYFSFANKLYFPELIQTDYQCCRYNINVKEVKIPKLKNIPDRMFSNNWDLEKITINQNAVIEQNAFEYCNFKNIDLKQGILLKSQIFKDNNNLNAIKIRCSIEDNSDVFLNCKNLKYAWISKEAKILSEFSWSGRVFDGADINKFVIYCETPDGKAYGEFFNYVDENSKARVEYNITEQQFNEIIAQGNGGAPVNFDGISYADDNGNIIA